MDFKPFNLAEAVTAGQSAALNRSKLDEIAHSLSARAGLRDAVSSGTPEAMELYRKAFPEQHQAYQNKQQTLDAGKLKNAVDQVEFIGQLLSGVDDEASFQDARNRYKSAGFPTDDIPANFDQKWIQQKLQQAISVKDRLTLYAKNNNIELKEIHDPTSPTGSRFVKEADAVGKPGKIPPGLDIEFGSDGKPIRISQGRKGSAGMGTAATTEVEKTILDKGDTMAHLKSIQKAYKPEFQQLGTRWSMLATRWKDKAGLDLPADEKQSLQAFSSYRADATQLFALTLKELSGVAVNPTEFERAQAWLPNPGTGLFDGDSPTELESKRQRFEDFTRRALIKYNYIKRNGLTKEDIDVNDVPTIVQKRGDEIAAKLQSRGVKGDDLKRAVKVELSDEFGFGLVK